MIETGRPGIYDQCGLHNTMTQAKMLLKSGIRWLSFELELVILMESCMCFADKIENFLMESMPRERTRKGEKRK